ncbi:MAG TPA: tetratricopeptide repeat protein [Kiritimatiellia bacterium]|nr:tetratricopeptide repeat protein [Kiritimatiellia bacterium]
MPRFFSIIAVAAAGALLFAASCSKPPGQAEFDRGVYELKRGNPVRARALLEKSISRRPGSEQNALAYNYLGVAAWRLGQYRVAQESFEDSRRLSPTLAEPVYNLAQLQQQEGNPVEAARLFEQAARMNEKDPRPVEMLASLYIQHRQWPLARRALHAALNRAPHSARILTALAVVDLHTIGPEKSIESHLIALEKDARYAPALFNVGLIYQTRLGDPERAAAYFKRFLAQKQPGPAADYARHALANPDLVSGPPVAPPPVQEFIATPTPTTTQPAPAPMPERPAPRTPEQREEELIRQAEVRGERGDTRGAMEQLLQAAEVARLDNRQPAQEKLLRAAARVAFDEGEAHRSLGDFLMERQRFEEALRAYKQAIVLEPQSFDAQAGMARAALKSGETDAALIGFTAATRIDPRNPDVLWDLAQLLDRQLQLPERAIATYREFEKLFPADPRTRRATERIRALTPAARAATPTAPAPRSAEPPTPLPTPASLPQPPTDAFPTPAARTPPATLPPAPQTIKPPARQLDLRPAASRNPAAAIAAFNQGTEHLKQRRWDLAITAFRRAVENDDRMDRGFYNLGLAHSQAGDYEIAKDAYLRALNLNPDLHVARYNLALLYYQTRDTASAALLAQDLVRRDPNYAVGHYLLGQIYSEKAETIPQARAAYSRFIELEPNHPAVAVVRQWLRAN